MQKLNEVLTWLITLGFFLGMAILEISIFLVMIGILIGVLKCLGI